MQLPFFIRKKKSKIEQIQTPFGGDVFFNPKSSVLRLRRRPKFLTINWKALWDTPHAKFLTTGVVLIIIFSGSLISFKSSASIATFTPESCLGGWEATTNATGLPSLPKDADAVEFHEDNSARLRGSSDIYCGDFRGEIPKDTSAKSFAVSFRISIDDGSVEHKKSEVIETEIEVKNTDQVDVVETTENDEESSGGGNGNIETFDEPQVETPVEIIEATTEPTNVTETETQTEPEPQLDPEPQAEPEAQSENPEQTVFKKIFGKKVFAQEETVSEPQVVSESEPEPQSEPSNEPEPQPEPQAVETEDAETDTVENPTPEESDTDSNDNETEETSEDKESYSSDNRDDEADEVAESPVPADAILIATYTLDGEKWETFGYIRMNSWEDSDFPIQLTDWDDLASLQVKLEPVPSFDRTPVVFLDAIVVEVEYDDSVENALSQPDFAHDTILSDSTVDDIRVIKILRDGVPMIWYTKLPPPPELVEVVPGIEPLLPGEEVPTENVDTIDVIDENPDSIPEILPVVEETIEPAETIVVPETPPTIEEVLPVENEVVPEPVVNDPVVWSQKIRNIFSLQKVLAQEGGGESGGDTGGDSSGEGTGSSGESSDSTESSNSSETSSTSSDTTEETNTSSVDSETTENSEEINTQTIEIGGDESTTNENTTEESAEDFFKDIIIPGEGVIIVDDLVNEIVPHGTDYFEETTDPLITTTEEIVPGVTPIVYTEEQIQDEIMKGLEWNLIAMGDTIDIATPIDISGGKIFWLSRDKTSLNEYNTNSGGISSQTVSSQNETEVKYTEPNGDISEITIDPVDLEITTPTEEETGIQNSTVPDFDGPKDSDTKSEILISEESIKKDEEDLVKSDTSI